MVKIRFDTTFFKNLNALFVIFGRLFEKNSFSRIEEASGIKLSIIFGKFLKRRVISFAIGGMSQKKRYPINPNIMINDNRVVRALGIFFLSRKDTHGFNALITINAIKNEKISSLTSHKRFKKIKKRIVKIIVFAEISIL